MKGRYVITGTTRIEDKVRLSLKPDDLVREKQPGIFDMVSNPQGLMNIMKQDAIFTQQPDLITIQHSEWKKYHYKIDDCVMINVEPGESDVSSDKSKRSQTKV